MPKPRIIDPAFWEDLDIIQLSRDERLLLVALITAGADDEGRTKANPAFIKRLAFAFDNDLGLVEIQAMTTNIRERCRNIQFYEDHGELYAWFRNWASYQKIKYVSKSKLPAPPENPPKDQSDSPELDKLERFGENWVEGRVGLGSVEEGCSRVDADEPVRDTTSPAGEVFRLWENSVGLLQPLQVDKLNDMINEYKAENVRDAILEAADTTNTFGMRYLRKILDRWKVEGKGRKRARASPGITIAPGVKQGPVG